MPSEYLCKLYLNNDLAQGRTRADRRPIHISDIHIPIFAVGAVRDHVAQWQSVLRADMLNDIGVTFVLTSGGHNAGIAAEPDHPRRAVRIKIWQADNFHIGPRHGVRKRGNKTDRGGSSGRSGSPPARAH